MGVHSNQAEATIKSVESPAWLSKQVELTGSCVTCIHTGFLQIRLDTPALGAIATRGVTVPKNHGSIRFDTVESQFSYALNPAKLQKNDRMFEF